MSVSTPPTRRLSSELSQLLRGSAFIFACRLAGAALTLLVQLLLARAMGAAELGVYALAFSWCVLLSSASTLGFIPAAVRFVGEGRARLDFDHVRAFVRFALRTTVVVGICVTAVGIALVWWLEQEKVDRMAMSAALAAVPMFAALLFMGGVANGFGRFALGFLPTSLVRPLLFFVLVVSMWALGYGVGARVALYLSFVSIVVVAIPVIVLSLRLVARQHGGGAPNDDAGMRKVWLRTSLSLMIPALFTSYFPDLIVIVAGFYLPSEALAVLHVCLRFAMLVTFVLFAVDTFSGPQIAYEYASRRMDVLQGIVDRATRLRFWVALGATVAFVVLGRPMLAVFGDEFTTGYPLLVILACGQLVQGAVGPVVRLMGVSEHQDRSIPVFVICFVLSIGMVAVLAPRFGAEGVAVAAALVMAIWGLALRHLTVRYLGIRPRIF